jgi:hypothetical protein
MTLDRLRALGIQLRHHRPGGQKTLCPRCSATRRKKREPCLYVKILQNARGALVARWHCYNGSCGWKGTTQTDEYNPKEWRKTAKKRAQPVGGIARRPAETSGISARRRGVAAVAGAAGPARPAPSRAAFAQAFKRL